MTALIYCPFPDAKSAEDTGAQLIEEGLIGCINIGGSLLSIYSWNGETGRGNECPALLKTEARLLEKAIARLEGLHPYDTPAILGWECVGGAATRSWLGKLGEGSEK